MEMAREALSSIDRAWLRMEDPTHPMIITVLLVFDAPIDFEQLQAVLERRLLQFPRFRERVSWSREDGGSAVWEDDPSFDLDHHLVRTSLPVPGDDVALRAVVSKLLSRQLDFSRPLWQIHLIEPYHGGCALVGRVHHCLADGPALVHTLYALADGAEYTPGAGDLLRDSAEPVQRRWGDLAGQLTELLWREGPGLLRNPQRLWSFARLGLDATQSLHKLVTRPHDPDTVFRGALGVVKCAAWSEPARLEDIIAIGRLVGGTVNDAMLSASAGALRRYLQGRGEPVAGLTVRAGLSVDLRSLADGPRLGNQAGAVLVGLPIGVADPLERLALVKREMNALKRSPEGILVRGLLRAMGQAPPETQEALVEAYCTRDSAVMANVRGPSETIHLAGATLGSLFFWAPAFGRTGLGLNIISYAGQVRLCVVTDQGLVPDPETIVGEFQLELEELRTLARQRENHRLEIRSSFQEMSTKLDDALRTLDAMLHREAFGRRR
jgi:WS/DGAT/MGAT family acyltransferase